MTAVGYPPVSSSVGGRVSPATTKSRLKTVPPWGPTPVGVGVDPPAPPAPPAPPVPFPVVVVPPQAVTAAIRVPVTSIQGKVGILMVLASLPPALGVVELESDS